MLDKVNQQPLFKLALAIACGVFGGLLAYRLLLLARSQWLDLPSATQEDLLAFAALAVTTGALYYGLRRLSVRYAWDLLTVSPDPNVALEVSSLARHVCQSIALSLLVFLLSASLEADSPASFTIVLIATLAWLTFQIRTRFNQIKKHRAA